MTTIETYTRKIISASVSALMARGVTEYAPRLPALGQRAVETPQATLDAIHAAHADLIASFRASDDCNLRYYAESHAGRSGADVLHWAHSILAGRYE